MSFRKRFTILLPGLMLFTVAAYPQSNNCLADVSSANSCSANDVSIAAVQAGSVNVFQGGPGGAKCFAGQKFSFTATFEVKTTSNKTRSNIGVFFGTGQQSALHGTCTDAILSPLHSCANGTATCGSAEYEELDKNINGETTTGTSAGCGDTTSQDTSPDFGAGTQQATLEVDNVTCPTSGTSLTLPVCTSWYQPTSTMPVCESPAPNYPWQPQAIAGTGSKCTCGTLAIPVQPIQPAITVAKSCNIVPDTTTGLTTCHAGAEGGTVQYTVAINNTTPSGQGGVIVDQICDSQYGTIYDDNTVSTRCPSAPLASSLIAGSASSCASLGTISTSASCTFEVNHGENLSVTDAVTVNGHSSVSSTAFFPSKTSNTVTADSTDAPTTATTTKGLAPGPIFGCLTLRYNVNVANTSAADEAVTLNSSGTPGTVGYVAALLDSYFHDVTATHGSSSVAGSVTGTTCGVAAGSAGLGTLSGTTASSTNGGAFPATLTAGTGTPPTNNGGTYNCQFDGVICGTPGPITTSAGQCAVGLQNVDTVNPNLAGDDPAPNADTVTVNANQFTANVCLVQQ